MRSFQHQTTYEATVKNLPAKNKSPKTKSGLAARRMTASVPPNETPEKELIDMKMFKGLSKKMTKGISHQRYGKLKEAVVLNSRQDSFEGQQERNLGKD